MHNHAASNSDSAQLEHARDIASRFELPEPLEVRDFNGKGNINQQTYLVIAGLPKKRRQFLLQLLNPGVFTQPHAVMNGMISCIRAQQRALSEGALRDDEWETIQLVRTRQGEDYLEAPGESGKVCWRMMVKIDNALTFRSLQEIPGPEMRLRIAEQAGRGLALFRVLTAGMDVTKIASPLPGYRDTELYYSQLFSVLSGSRTLSESEAYLPADPVVRESTRQHFLIRLDPVEYRRRLEDPQLRPFIDLAIEQKSFGLSLIRKLKSGELTKVVVHGDTKLENFIFSTQTGKVKALVDLDTIMPHTWLGDWGDMVRSLVNVAGEREKDLERIDIDQEVFTALAKGYLGSAHRTDSREAALMVDAPQIMALELGVRFLADYLRGDSYFQLRAGDPQDLNKIRAMVQFSVFQRLRSKATSAKKLVESLPS
jgi:N-acetylhexosamine 1-kinase